jgi:predicted TPR repeat methyltransferase
MTKKMLQNAYGLDSGEATRGFYNEWAATYDDEVAENGYITPDRCATALASFVSDPTEPLLDVGCGTGISGAALRGHGFTTLDGCDFSAEMLKLATDKGVYRKLHNTDLEAPFPFEQGAYANIAAIGVLNPGHAPASTFDEIVALLNPGGHFVFSLNDHAMADKSYETRIMEHVDTGSVSLLFSEYGDHLPKIDLKSNVYVVRKA